MNAEPRAGGTLSTQTRPPTRSTVFWTIDSPTPPLALSAAPFSVWKMAKIRWWCCGAMPGPSSSTRTCTIPATARADTATSPVARSW